MLFANQTAHMISAWVEGEHDPKKFMVPWKESSESAGPKSEADLAFEQIGNSQRLAGLDAG